MKSMGLVKQQGLSLIELVIVVIMLGILGAIASSALDGSTDSAKAAAKMTLASEGTAKAGAIFRLMGSGNAVPGNPVVHANNSLEDVLFTNTGVAATYQTRFDAQQMASFRNAINVTTEPVEDTSAGAYAMPDTDSVITLITAGNRQIGWQFTNTTSAEVQALVAKYDNATAYVSTTADTSGAIQYDADSGGTGLHTLVIVRDF